MAKTLKIDPDPRGPSRNDSRLLAGRRLLWRKLDAMRSAFEEFDRHAEDGAVEDHLRGQCAALAVQADQCRAAAQKLVYGIDVDEAVRPILNQLTMLVAALIHGTGSSPSDPVGLGTLSYSCVDAVKRLHEAAGELMLEAQRMETVSR